MTIPYIRNLTTDDLLTVHAIQASCYSAEFLEPVASFARKLEAAPSWSWLAQLDGLPAGYLVGLPVAHLKSPDIPALAGTASLPLVRQAEGFYLHDLAVPPQHRGKGVAPALFAAALQQAQTQQVRQMMLVAVQGSTDFWSRFGFEASPHPAPELQRKLRSFGDGAVFMTRTLRE